MALSDFRGHWALVTGASAGIGREFAAQLAAAGMNVVLVARRAPLLAALSDELARRHGTETLVVPADLSKPNAAARIRSQVQAKGVKIRLLVNNAGAGRMGRFEATPEAVYDDIVSLNAAAVVSMCRAFFDHLTAFPESAVVNVSSQAAYQPVPYMAVYAATKAFVHSFSQALYGEWREKGVFVQTLVPGPTASEFDAKAGAYECAVGPRGSARDVVAAALARIGQDAPVVAAVRGTYRQRLLASLLPPRVLIREVAKIFRPPQMAGTQARAEALGNLVGRKTRSVG
jgi:short-subunit dehydrogenase